MWCDFKAVRGKNNEFKCRRCFGPTVRPKFPREQHEIHRPCEGAPGLGDYVAKLIETVLPWTKKKKCNSCKQRQEALNAIGRKITGRG
jgi:hypothetical protein